MVLKTRCQVKLGEICRISRAGIAAIGVFAISAVICLCMIQELDEKRIKIERSRISDMATNYMMAVQNRIERALSATYAISAMVQQRNGNLEHFDKLAEKMLPLYPGIDSLQLAPGGIVQQIVPIAGNEKAIGHDLFGDKNRSKEAIEARDSRKLTFAGPFKLLQGGYGGIGRLPIYIANDFWGFSNVLIRFPEVLENTGVLQLEEKGFAYQLWRKHPDGGHKDVIASSTAALAGSPVECSFEVPGAAWVLSITPKNGWDDRQGLFYKGLAGLLFSLMLSWITKLTIELKLREKELEYMALLDDLTKLPNRRLLTDRLEQALAHARRSGNLVAVCYLDIDGFKAINDQFGHATGDQLLIRVANRLQGCLRQGDTLARLGGDEFVVVLPDMKDKSECEVVLRRILQLSEEPIGLQGQELKISLSIGVTLYPEDDQNIEMLLQHADTAMYKVKQTCKGKSCFFNS